MDVSCDFTLERGSFALSARADLSSGESLALIGPSGAGKSLFLSALCGFETVTGRIAFGGRDAVGLRPQARPLSVMFQSHNLFPHLSVFDNVALGRDPGLRLSDQDRADVSAALDTVGLTGFGSRLPDALSGGQASRAALARTVLRDQPILLLDEPFAALGPRLRRDMLAMVLDLQRTRRFTLIFVTHDPEEARAAARTSFVHDGRLAPPVLTQTLFDNPPEALRAYL